MQRLAGRVRQLELQHQARRPAPKPAVKQAKCDHLSETGETLWKRYGAGKAGSLAVCKACNLKVQWNKGEGKWQAFEPKSRASSSALPPPSSGAPMPPSSSPSTPAPSHKARSKAAPRQATAPTTPASAASASTEESTSMWQQVDVPPLPRAEESEWSDLDQEMSAEEDDV